MPLTSVEEGPCYPGLPSEAATNVNACSKLPIQLPSLLLSFRNLEKSLGLGFPFFQMGTIMMMTDTQEALGGEMHQAPGGSLATAAVAVSHCRGSQ